MPPINRKSYTVDENQFLKNIGFKIQFFRKQRGLSQNELAEKAGLSYTTISHIESTSVYGLSIIAIYRIAKALDVDPSQLLMFK
jgi:transcriptional regulator with XRE-family HTH domain